MFSKTLKCVGKQLRSPRANLWVRNLNAHSYTEPKGEHFSMTKIVGTIGPVSENFATMQALTDEGLRVMRINFSHATFEEATLRMTNLRKCRGVHSKYGHHFNLRAILLDTQGPEIRTGSFEKGLQEVVLTAGTQVILTVNESFRHTGTCNKFFVSYAKLPSTVKIGDDILLDDGLIRLRVVQVQGEEVVCDVVNTETLGNRKGVNLPGLVVDLPALTAKDKIDIEFGIKNDIDFVAASFVRKAADVENIRAFIESIASKHYPKTHPRPQIISKIENYEGIANFDEILKLSDGIMVARGDLGVEIPMQQVLTAQKMMVQKCNAVGKPVIVATQMLENMIKNPRPTRAEVSDIGNAVLDGADCVMLSGEVAKGKYPIESVKTMLLIIKEAETSGLSKSSSSTTTTTTFSPCLVKNAAIESDLESMAKACVQAAKDAQAKLIIVLTETGYTARMVAKYQPHVPVMCYASCKKVGRLLQIHRGLYPVVNEGPNKRPSIEEAIKNAKDMKWLRSRDKVVVISAEELSEHVGTQILLRVAQVK